MENSNTNHYNHENESVFRQSVSVYDLMRSVFKNWLWFVISLTVFLSLGALHILRTAPVYQREATILVKDARKGSAASELAAFADIAGMSTRRSVDNELYVLQARRLMVEVVNRLGLTISYAAKGTFRAVELYKNSPIAATFIDDLGGQPCSFTVTLGAEDFTITEFSRPRKKGVDPKADNKYVVSGKYGETVALPNGAVVIEPTLYFADSYIGTEIRVRKNTSEAVATAYRNRIKSAVASKMSSIINLSLADVVPQRAEDIMNTLINVYNDDAVQDKQIVAEATSRFITERLQVLGDELRVVDGDIKRFKDKNSIVDIRTEATRRTEGAMRYEQEIAATNNAIAMAKFICNYLDSSTNEANLIPTTTFDGSTAVAVQISDYNELVLRRRKLGTDNKNNPIVQNLDFSIAQTKNAIVASLSSHAKALEIKLKNLEAEERRISNLIGAVPTQEQEYLSIARQQKIKEELYLYLLTKNEENAISLAITEHPARVVDYAFGLARPISPNRTLIMLAMVILGLGIPFGIIYLVKLTDTKVQGRRDIVRLCTVPYLGDIPLSDGNINRSVAVRESGRDKVSEAFKVLRTNMSFMARGQKQQVILITSSNAHAGKTFVSMNLGMTLAFSGNKVLMIDMDLRRRTLSKHMGQRSNPNGVTKFLSDPATNVNDIITNSALHENFDFIYAGLQPPNPAELLMSNRLDQLIEECSKIYDYIIIDSVPALIIADAMITSRVADLSMYVVRQGMLDRSQLADINDLHTEQRLKNMCIVLNGSVETRQSYGYSYRYQYTSDPNVGKWWYRLLQAVGLK